MIPAAHVIFCLDWSSSMVGMRRPTQRAYNAFVETLQMCKGAEIHFTRLDFGWAVKTSIDRVHIQDAPILGKYVPTEGTALNLAIGRAIEYGRMTADKEKPIIVVQTDGVNERPGPTDSFLKAQVTQCLQEGWDFLFLGAVKCLGKGHVDKKIQQREVKGMTSRAMRKGFPGESILPYGTDETAIVGAFETAAVSVGSVAARLAEHANFKKIEPAA